MMQPRLVQNFRGGRAFIVVNEATAIEPLVVTLGKLGVQIAGVHSDPREIDPASLQADQHFVFLDGDLQCPIAWPLSSIAQLPPAPLVGLVGVEAPSRLRALVQAGATAFLRKPVHGATVYSALYIAVNQYRQRRELEQCIDEHDRRRRGRRHVIKAVLSLVQARGIDDETAYDILRRDSMRERQSLEQYCEAFLQETSSQTGPPARRRRLNAD